MRSIALSATAVTVCKTIIDGESRTIVAADPGVAVVAEYPLPFRLGHHAPI